MHNLTLSSTTQIEWKLRRGQWRPKLLDFAKAVPNDTIQGASQLAYAVAEEATVSNAEEYTKMCKAALEPLLKIKVRVGQIFLLRGIMQVSCQKQSAIHFEMQGIGPASASAILTAAFSCFPYFSDETMEVVLKKKEYTVKRYIEFAVAVREKALQLSSKGRIYLSCPCSLSYQNHGTRGLI